VKRKNYAANVTNPDIIIADDSGDMVPLYSTQSPVCISTQPSAVCYTKSNDYVTKPPHFDDDTKLTYTSSMLPPTYASDNVTPATQDIVQ